MSGVGTLCECQTSFQWKIQNFLSLNVDNGDCITSPDFTLIGREGKQKKFHLDLYPKGDEDADWVEIYLTPDDSLNSCTVSYKLSILDKEKKQFIHKTVRDHTFCDKDWGFDRFVEIQKLKLKEETVLPNGTLTIFFESDGVQVKPKDPTMCLGDDLNKLLRNDEYTDVEIKCEDAILKCHKAILVARAPYFRAMFNSPLKESQTGKVQIDGMEPDVLKDMILFIYSGKVKTMRKNAVELFKAADMYMIDSLKDLCGTYLMNNLNNENVLTCLSLADNKCEMLKKAAMKFIVENDTDFSETSEWRDLSKELLIEIIKCQKVRTRRLVGLKDNEEEEEEGEDIDDEEGEDDEGEDDEEEED